MAGRSKAPKCPNCGHLHTKMINDEIFFNNGSAIYFPCDKCGARIESRVVINFVSKLV